MMFTFAGNYAQMIKSLLCFWL